MSQVQRTPVSPELTWESQGWETHTEMKNGAGGVFLELRKQVLAGGEDVHAAVMKGQLAGTYLLTHGPGWSGLNGPCRGNMGRTQPRKQ